VALRRTLKKITDESFLNPFSLDCPEDLHEISFEVLCAQYDLRKASKARKDATEAARRAAHGAVCN